MENQVLAITAMICGTLLLSIILIMIGWLKKEQQRTLRKIMDREDLNQEELAKILSPPSPYNQDFRRGILFLAFGLSIGISMYLMGGIGWTLCIIPVGAGLVYLLLWRLNVPKN